VTSMTLPLARVDGLAVAPAVVDVNAMFIAHAPFLLRVVERMTGRGSHVEDIVQDVFLVAHRRRGDLRIEAGDESAARGWLYGVARLRISQHKRSLWRFFRLRDAAEVEPTTPSPTTDDMVQRRATAMRVRASALALPLLQREVFVLHELEGMPTAQVAKVLGIAEGTVWSRLSSARQQFRIHYQTTAIGGGP
jgi:RNA polymerase sigma-70 factor, ECF subfamily